MFHVLPCLVGLAVAAGDPVVEATTTDQQIQALTKLVGELRDEVHDLRAERGHEWVSEHRASEICSLVAETLADADARSSLLQGGSIGYDGGFRIGGNGFSMKINGQLQARFVYNNVDAGGAMVDENQSGFEARRTKLKFSGNVIDDTLGYTISGAFEDTRSSDGEFELEDAEISKKWGNWKLRVGQFKPQFMREELISSSRQLAVERSLMNERFNQDRSQGIELSWQSDQFRWAVMYHDGIQDPAHGGGGGRNTGAIGVAAANDYEFGFAGRAEYLMSGQWKQFKDFTGWRGGDVGVLLGAGINYQKSESGAFAGTPLAATNEPEDLRLTADASFEWDGANAFIAFAYQQYEVDGAAPVIDEDNWGLVAQAGYFVSDKTEVFVRYEMGEDDLAVTPGVEDLSVLTFGFNHYWNTHNMKWTTDLGLVLDELDGVNSRWVTSSSGGYRGDSAGQDGQIVVRSQIQLGF